MLILSAARTVPRDVPGRYPGMVTQTRNQKQNKTLYSYGFNQSTLEIDTALTPTVVQLEKKSCITADDDPLYSNYASS
jgi:hypothetical protein